MLIPKTAPVTLCIALFSWPLAINAAPVSFTGLGDLEGGIFSSSAADVSADGSVVVGASQSSKGLEAFRWENGKMVGLGGLSSPPYESYAWGVSGDGQAIVGISENNSGKYAACQWAHGSLTSLSNYYYSILDDTNPDGSISVGTLYLQGGYWAFRLDGSMVTMLGELPGGAYYSEGKAVNDDGSVIVGRSHTAQGYEAYRWENNIMTGLGDFAGGTFKSYANAVSADGSIIVGAGTSSTGLEAFIWENGVMSRLGDIPENYMETIANDISADGTIVVGHCQNSTMQEAFLWDKVNGLRLLKPELEAAGLNLDGWTLEYAYAVSADGTTIVGEGINPDGRQEAWVAHIPEPCTLALVAGTLPALNQRKRRA